ncbi:hypothetical protein Tcan_00816, partial [Toxocara canis]
HCAIHWILDENRQLVRFVDNRVKEIRSIKATMGMSTPEKNPADLATRGASFDNIRNGNLWWTVPDWLQHQESAWPDSKPMKNIKKEGSGTARRKNHGNIVRFEQIRNDREGNRDSGGD